MRFLNSKRKYLMLMPLAFLLVSALFFRHASQEIAETMLREKHYEAVHAVEMLAAAVEANTERDWEDHELNIISSVEYVDKLHQIYAGAFKLVDGEYVLITERFYETSPFEPFDYPQFAQSVESSESGAVIINYAPEGQGYRDLHLHFRWMPLYSPEGQRYLVVAGVSRLSIATQVPAWVSTGQIVSTAVTFIINTVLIVMIIRLGHIYDSRDGCKWRKPKDEREDLYV